MMPPNISWPSHSTRAVRTSKRTARSFCGLPLTDTFNEFLCVLTTNSQNESGFRLWAGFLQKLGQLSQPSKFCSLCFREITSSNGSHTVFPVVLMEKNVGCLFLKILR